MTRQQFLDQHFHEFFGMIADGALCGRQGAELSVWLRQMQSRTLALLGRAFDQLSTPAQLPPTANHKEKHERPAKAP